MRGRWPLLFPAKRTRGEGAVRSGWDSKGAASHGAVGGATWSHRLPTAGLVIRGGVPASIAHTWRSTVPQRGGPPLLAHWWRLGPTDIVREGGLALDGPQFWMTHHTTSTRHGVELGRLRWEGPWLPWNARTELLYVGEGACWREGG